MSTHITPELFSTAGSSAPFDIPAYLSRRTSADTFLMVEFGHDALPVAHRQSRPFTGNRAYIGYEAWLRDPHSRKRERFQNAHEPTNIHFQTLALGGIARSIDGDQEYYGEYNPSTPLPDGSVEEIVLGNVFSDPYVVYSYERSHAMLGEAARILADDGVIVIRETIRPDRVGAPFEKSIAAHGLNVLARITQSDEQWDSLEEQFMTDPDCDPGSYYLLLSK